MGALDNLEKTLGDLFEKKAPKLPVNGRKSLAKAMWIITLVFGVLQLWAAWGFWHIGHYLDRSVDYLNSISTYYGTPAVADSHLGLIYYTSLLVLLFDALLLLLATPGLKAMRKAGWNLLFYSMLLNVVYGFVRMFAEVGGGIEQLVWSLVVSAVGFYFLFQIREEFTAKGTAVHKATPSGDTTKK